MPKNPRDLNDRMKIGEFLLNEERRYSSPENYGEAIIVTLKLYGILQKSHKYYLIGVTKVMENLIKNSIEDPAVELQNNQELAKHLLK